jgi:heme a synthase
MFLFPYARWVGGIFWEHSHRLIGTGVGFLTLILVAFTFWKEKRIWMRWLAVVALVAVSVQGVLGGERVTLKWDQLGIFHAALAQSFFGLLLIIAAVTGKGFLAGKWTGDTAASSLRRLGIAALFLTYFQLGIAATIRHQHAPLAIRDFPAAYGRLFPDTSREALQRINEERQHDGVAPVSVAQIHLQMTHRFGAVALLLVVIAFVARVVKVTPLGHWLRGWSLLWCGAILLQILLGGVTIWSNKQGYVATSHLALGALLTAFTILLVFRLFCAGRGTGEGEA